MRYLTIEETMDRLGVSRNTVYRLLPSLGAVDLTRGAAGKRLIRIPEAGIAAYLEDCAIMPPTPARSAKKPFYIERRRG